MVEAQKDYLPIGMNKNVEYKLACKNCDVAYVGQTKRKLNTRIAEHKKDINKKTSNHSVITEHRIWSWLWLEESKNIRYRKTWSKKINVWND